MCPEQNICASRPELCQHLVVRPPTSRSVKVHSENLPARKQSPQLLMHLLSPEGMKSDFYAPAIWTDRRRVLHNAAVVASEMLLHRMIRQRHLAAVAFFYMPAVEALHNMRKAPSVLEKNCTFLFLDACCNLIGEQSGDR